MRAMVLHEHGGMEKLVFEPNWPKPKAEEGHVVIRTRATSLNYHDVFTRRGMPGIKVPLPVIIGLDLAGDLELKALANLEGAGGLNALAAHGFVGVG